MTDLWYPTAFSSWRPYDDSAEWTAYERVLRSGRLTMGPETEAFEAEIAAYHGRRHAVAVNSGSSANLVSVAAILTKREPEIIPVCMNVSVPAIAWSTTYAPLAQHGASFVVRDCDDTWNAPARSLAWRTGDPPSRDQWSLLVACPALGNAAHVGEAAATANLDGLTLLEDNCESLGARDHVGRLTGTFGDVSTGSGYHSHQLSAVELGWALTDDDELARLMRLLRNHGNIGWSAIEPSSRYEFTIFGYNLRPLEAHCAVAREQLKRLDVANRHRRANAERFRVLTEGLPVVNQLLVGTPAPFGLAFMVEDAPARARLSAAFLAAEIDWRPPTGGSFTRHPYGAPWRDKPTPRADRVHDTGLFLGNAPYPITRLIEKAVKVMKSAL